MANYQEKLKDRRWQRKRLQIMDRDHWTCTRCQCPRNDVQLHVHHTRYPWKDYFENVLAEPWECPGDDLETLCEACHSQHHGKTPKRRFSVTVGERINYSILLRGREVGETGVEFERKRNKVLDDLTRIQGEEKRG